MKDSTLLNDGELSGSHVCDARDVSSAQASRNSAIPYRADIDGLRAVAVTAVVAFHAGFGGLPGGFTGVDVFFVVSGFLIGAQVFRQSTSGEFRYLSFYARRLRRIIPALIALLLSFWAIGWCLLTPGEMRELGKETVAAVAGASNFLFYMGGDYFAPAADLNPLLHTWSLGVEEQFYIVLPILAVVFIRVFRAPAFKALLVLTVITFAGSIFLTYMEPQAAFYLLPTRFWELSLGALIATSTLDNSQRAGGRVAQSLGLGGGVLILIGIFAYEPQFAFPGAFALLPTVGAAMVITARSSWVNRNVLANPVAVFLGKISYSWYLWHWPLFYLARVLEIEHRVNPAVLALTSLVLGVVSWRVIEEPFRRRRLPDRTVVMRYVAAIVSVALVGAVTYQQDGFPDRLPANARNSAEDSRRTQDDPCLLRRSDLSVAPAGCKYSTSDGPAVALVGDSHGASISPGFAHAASSQNRTFRQLTKSLCTGQWGYANVVDDLPDFPAECLAYQEAAFKQVENDPDLGVVVLASRWSLEQQLVTEVGMPIVGLETALESTVARLDKLGRKVVLVQDVPAFHFDPYARVIGESLPVRAFLRSAFGVSSSGGTAPFSQMESDNSRSILERVAAKHRNVMLFDPWQQLCNATGCQFQDGDDLYYFDSQHLTNVGALRAVGAGPQLSTG